jgi:hypothetical protein
MTADGIKSFLNVRPFKAFTIHAAGGESIRVVSLESIHLAEKLGLVIVYPPDDSLVMRDLRQITSAAYPSPAKTKGKPQ